MTTFNGGPEVGVLRQVRLHRSDLELRRLTPSNCQALLFGVVDIVVATPPGYECDLDLLQTAEHLCLSSGSLVLPVHDSCGTPEAHEVREATATELRGSGLPHTSTAGSSVR